MTEVSQKTIWILSDGLPGHVNQSIGIAQALSKDFPLEPILINVELRHKLLRPLMRLVANNLPSLLSGRVLKLFCRLDHLPAEPPVLIVSAGGNTLFANVALASIYGVPNVFSGTMKGYKNKRVRSIFTVVPLADRTNNVVLDLPPANVSNTQSDATVASDSRYYALLVGGDGAGYRYTAEDWRQLANALKRISERDGVRWLLTTSRRTGVQAETYLQGAVDFCICEEQIWYGSSPVKVVKRFLSQSDVVFCTEDSLTMISEAIYAQKPVVTIQPSVMSPDSNDAQALDKYQRLGFIRRVKIAEMAELSLDRAAFCQQYPDVPAQISDAVRALS